MDTRQPTLYPVSLSRSSPFLRPTTLRALTLATTLLPHTSTAFEFEAAQTFSCTKCGYNTPSGFPIVDSIVDWAYYQSASSWSILSRTKKPPSKPSIVEPSVQSINITGKEKLIIPKHVGKVVPDVWLRIADMLSEGDIDRLGRALPSIGQLMYQIQLRKQLVCFVTRKNYREATMGIGIEVTGRVITSVFDLISYEAYENGYRKTIWGTPFSLFLPLALDECHFDRSLPLIMDCIDDVAKATLSNKAIGRLNQLGIGLTANGDALLPHNPHTASLILRRMINQMLIRLMKECDDWEEKYKQPAAKYAATSKFDVLESHAITEEREERRKLADAGVFFQTITHASERMMDGYFHRLHLLLSLAERYPEIEVEAEKSVRCFIEDTKARAKHVIPDLGEFIPLLCLCKDSSWKDVYPTYLEEVGVRDVFWCLDPEKGKGLGSLAYLEQQEISDFRLQETFESSKTSLRLLMFQQLFFCNLAQFIVPGLTTAPTNLTPTITRQLLDNTYGFPLAGVSQYLVGAMKRIYRVRTWEEMYAQIGVNPLPSPAEICRMLRDAVVHSEQRGYHSCPLNRDELLMYRISVDKELGKEDRKNLRKKNVRYTLLEMQKMSFSECRTDFAGNASGRDAGGTGGVTSGGGWGGNGRRGSFGPRGAGQRRGWREDSDGWIVPK